jgi:hypothetical protein
MIEIIKRLPVGALQQTKDADMPDIFHWRVIRPHDGDRWYNEGDVRKGTKHDLGHLAPKTLELIGPATEGPDDDQAEKSTAKRPGRAKAETSAQTNKAEGAAKANKADPGQTAS